MDRLLQESYNTHFFPFSFAFIKAISVALDVRFLPFNLQSLKSFVSSLLVIFVFSLSAMTNFLKALTSSSSPDDVILKIQCRAEMVNNMHIMDDGGVV